MSNTKSVETTHRAEKELGPAIQDGVVRWVSQSLLNVADHDTVGGCLRKIYFERVMGFRQPASKSADRGVALHAEIEFYMRTGQDVLSPFTRAAKWAIPTLTTDIEVEKPIIEGAGGQITKVHLTADGVPVAGHVDVYNFSSEYITPEAEFAPLAEDEFEVKDWKTVGDWKHMKTAQQVADSLQGTIYAKAGFVFRPTKTKVRFSNVFIHREKPEARMVTTTRTRDQVDERFQHVEDVTRKLKLAVIQPWVESVEANTKACQAYGIRCPHLARCSVGLGIFRRALAVELFQVDEAVSAKLDFEDKPMLSSVDNKTELEKLLAEETQLRQAFDPSPPAPVPGTPDFVASCSTIQASPLGFPNLTGTAALMYATANGLPLSPGMTIPGRDRLAKLVLDKPAEVIRLAAELRAKYPDLGKPAVDPEPTPEPEPAPVVKTVQHLEPPVSILPPDAPESQPHLAADPLPAEVPVVEAPAPATESSPAPTNTVPAKKRGRPAKHKIEPIVTFGDTPNETFSFGATADEMIMALEFHLGSGACTAASFRQTITYLYGGILQGKYAD